jgi:hypothetical protein
MPVNAEPLIEFGTSHRIVYIKRLSTKNTISSIGKGIIGSQDEEKTRLPLNDWTAGSVIFVPSNGGKAVGWVHNTTTTTTTTVNDDDATTTTTTTTTVESTDNNDDGNKNKSTDNNIGSGYATICVVKIPLSQLEEEEEEDIDDGDDNIKRNEHETSTTNNHIIQKQTSQNWFTKILEYCRLGLQQLHHQQQQEQEQRQQQVVMGNDGLETNTNENNNSNRNDDYVYYKFTDQLASDIRNVLQQLDKNNGNGDNDGTATTSSAAAASNKSIPEPKN